MSRSEDLAAALERTSAEHAVPDQAETIRLLEEGGAEVAAAIRALSDEELDRAGRAT